MSDSRSETDRGIRESADLEGVAFDANGLVPVVSQDAASGAVLMVAWANREALEHSLETGQMHFWSRSRGELWRKGETSGNTLALVSLHADCDGDTLLARVTPAGPACHTGDATCFGANATPGETHVLGALARVIRARNRERPEGSYTTRLLEDGNLRLKKLGEELAEVVAALARGDGDATEEAADLVYHLMVALEAGGTGWDEVEEILARRAG